MPDLENQKQAFEFFSQRFNSQEPFTKDDLARLTSWSANSIDTYWSKQFRPFVKAIGGGRYRVTEAFRSFATWDRFRQHVTQVRYLAATDYTKTEYSNVLIYEFFMPLTNEPALRATLDALFYKDTILAKLRSLEPNDLNEQMPRQQGESLDAQLERTCEWVAKMFVGYSISHVTGRFRSESLATHEEAAKIEKSGRYLIDETTAITRFIFPCSEGEVERLRWFFELLFIDSIIAVVNGEDEIWMVESGLRNLLHIWRVEKAN